MRMRVRMGVRMRVRMSEGMRVRRRGQESSVAAVVVTAVVVVYGVVVRVVRRQVGPVAVGQTQEVGQILPPMFHAHRAHQRHAHLQ